MSPVTPTQPTAPSPGTGSMLTEREREMVYGVHAGQTNEEIGAAHFLSPATVKTHLSSAQTKLGLTGRLQLALLVERSGLLG